MWQKSWASIRLCSLSPRASLSSGVAAAATKRELPAVTQAWFMSIKLWALLIALRGYYMQINVQYNLFVLAHFYGNDVQFIQYTIKIVLKGQFNQKKKSVIIYLLYLPSCWPLLCFCVLFEVLKAWHPSIINEWKKEWLWRRTVISPFVFYRKKKNCFGTTWWRTTIFGWTISLNICVYLLFVKDILFLTDSECESGSA